MYVGYGLAGRKASTRRCVSIPVHDTCDETFSYVHPDMRTCHGDSGGGVFLDEGDEVVLVGLTLWGDAACESYGVSADVGSYRDWIVARAGADWHRTPSPKQGPLPMASRAPSPPPGTFRCFIELEGAGESQPPAGSEMEFFVDGTLAATLKDRQGSRISLGNLAPGVHGIRIRATLPGQPDMGCTGTFHVDRAHVFDLEVMQCNPSIRDSQGRPVATECPFTCVLTSIP
jgi:hypothetical protein